MMYTVYIYIDNLYIYLCTDNICICDMYLYIHILYVCTYRYTWVSMLGIFGECELK